MSTEFSDERFDSHISKTKNGVPKWFDSKSPYGYVIGDAISACIKCIRRDDFRAATFWAHQVAISGQDAEEFLWNTLAIHAIEDVGLSCPDLIVLVEMCRLLYFRLPPQNEARFMIVFFVVRRMCQVSKSRAVDDGYTMMAQTLRKSRDLPEIPDIAFDLHTRKGKQLGRGLKHYVEEASAADNEDMSVRDVEAHKWMRRIAGIE